MSLSMMKIFHISLILVTLVVACSGNDQSTDTDNYIVHPILNMEVVEIPSEGTVTLIRGNSQIKKKGKNEYSGINIDTVVSEDDIIWLKKNSELKISFTDGSHILNEPQAKDIFITFNLAIHK